MRRYEKQFLHGKGYLFSHENGAIAGSSNFTGAGLTTNLELNLGQYQPEIVCKVEKWFERLWAEAVPYDLAAIYEARFEEYSPYLIYLRVLWERYHHELLAEASQTGVIHLTRFQTDGLDRAKRILRKYNGVLIADGVGLGKTFLAGELLTDVIQRNRQRALLIAPAALRDGTWERFQNRFQLYVETISFEQLTAAMQNEGDSGLKSAPSEYSLIIVDEAHAFRATDSQRSQALRKLIRGDPPKKVVLMTATPVNNSLWDLHDLLGYFIDHDAVFADAGIPSLRRRFEEASKEDPFSLKPDTLFDVLDATTVRRTRHFVQRYYPEDRITLPGGEQVVIHFPQPHVESRSYDLDKAFPGFFYQITEILAPEEGEPKLTMARYWPMRYARGGKSDNRQAALIGLIRSGLLKRFESSVKAFADTTRRMVDAHTTFLDGLGRGVLISSPELAEIAETDSDEAWEELISASVPLSAMEIDVKRLAADVRQDRDLLQQMHDRAATVSAKKDPKLRLLTEKLKEILGESETRLTEEDKRNSRKVLVFSYFADTVEWIAEFLKDALAKDSSLVAYRGRLAVVHGDESYGGVTRERAVFGFAPKSSEAPAGQDADLYDILVTTDVLAEGMNLQQASRIINYDLPWNPMRLVQRHGRIDRIGSPHSDVFITCIFPDAQLDELLTLEERLRRK
ncbi:MAG TPA: helicase-related protein, partial [Thermoanaerobaculia bacterium]|nr:helicase-related protein [Thermoanaerobaculia bacterium]